MIKMRFDYIIHNPPYKRGLHIKFFECSLDIISTTGKIVIIEPSSWLINVRKNGKAKSIYTPLKKKLEGHVKSVVIENLNREFNISLSAPCSITTIDMEKKYNKVDFYNCGEYKKVNSIFDCNLIGNYKLIQSILNKCLLYNDIMKDHIYNSKKSIINNNTYFTKYGHILSIIGCIFTAVTSGAKYESNYMYKKHKLGEFMSGYISSSYHTNYNEITNHIIKAVKRGSTNGTTGDKDAACLYGTKEELENWKYFTFNNSLPLFLNIILNYDQANKSKDYIPWLVDKRRTDEEIYNKLNLTHEEIDLIESTIKKFERHSSWFKRYSTGKDK